MPTTYWRVTEVHESLNDRNTYQRVLTLEQRNFYKENPEWGKDTVGAEEFLDAAWDDPDASSIEIDAPTIQLVDKNGEWNVGDLVQMTLTTPTS